MRKPPKLTRQTTECSLDDADYESIHLHGPQGHENPRGQKAPPNFLEKSVLKRRTDPLNDCKKRKGIFDSCLRLLELKIDVDPVT